jgi:hypothetical protein
MPEFTEANQNVAMRKRIPLREAFIEAFPEQTPVLSLIPKKSGVRTTSPESSEVEWPFKKFRRPRNRGVYDGDDVDFSTESEHNEDNKAMVKGRIQLIRTAVRTGRIAEAVINQHGGVQAGTGNSIHKDHVKDALRGMREDKNFIIVSDADSKAQATVGGTKVPYGTRGFVSWCRTGAHTDLPIPEMARIPAGNRLGLANVGEFDEDALNAMLQSCWDTRRTKGNWKMFNNSDMQLALNQFLCFGETSETKAPLRRYNNDASTGTIKLHVRIYQGSFGQVESIPVHDLPEQFEQEVTTANGDATLTVEDSGVMYPGMLVAGAGIPANTRVLYIVDGTHVELTANATATGTVTGTFGTEVFSELMDMDYIEFNYVDEVGWQPLENKGGGPRGYADSLCFLANLNPQAHGLIYKS